MISKACHAIGILLLTASSVSADSLADELELCLHEMHCPGALVGIAGAGVPTTVLAIGTSDAEGNEPMRADMRMRIGSVSKLFVGAVVLRLVDQGVLSLDRPVSDYLAGIPEGKKITLRMLGRHTSGLACPIWNDDFQADILADPRRQWTARELLDRAAALPSHHEPGRGWHYSNTAATVAGLVAEKATGKSYEELLAKLVLRPLSLRSTGLCEAAAPPEPTPKSYRHGRKGRWLGYGNTFCDVTGYSASWAGIGGNMYSTARDLNVATLSLATGRLLSEESRRELLACQDSDWDGTQFGFFISRNARGIGHEGNVPGFEAVVRYQPGHQRTIVVLTNLSNNADGTMPAEQLFDLVADHLNESPTQEAATSL